MKTILQLYANDGSLAKLLNNDLKAVTRPYLSANIVFESTSSIFRIHLPFYQLHFFPVSRYESDLKSLDRRRANDEF